MIYSNIPPNCKVSGDTIRVQLKATNLNGDEVVSGELILTPHVAESLWRRLQTEINDWRAKSEKVISMKTDRQKQDADLRGK